MYNKNICKSDIYSKVVAHELSFYATSQNNAAATKP